MDNSVKSSKTLLVAIKKEVERNYKTRGKAKYDFFFWGDKICLYICLGDLGYQFSAVTKK